MVIVYVLSAFYYYVNVIASLEVDIRVIIKLVKLLLSVEHTNVI